MAERTLDIHEVVSRAATADETVERTATADETDEFTQTAPYELRDLVDIANTSQAVETTQTAGTFTTALDAGVSPEITLAVGTTGPATLTLERSTETTFGGEQLTTTVAYDAAGEYLEVIPLAHRYVRASVNQNLDTLAVVRRGV